MTSLRLVKSIGRSSSRLALLLIPLVFACFALPPMARAVSPPPDGGYPGQNTAEGDDALLSLSPTDGGFNTAIGWWSLKSNITGSLNTGVGAGTLSLNLAHHNTAVGAGALFTNTTGDGNTANGALALFSNTVGRGNTALGGTALLFNVTGPGNTAVGLDALYSNTTGNGNTAVGAGTSHPDADAGPAPLGSNTTGSSNTAVGGTSGAAAALGSNDIGSFNTAVGAGTLSSKGALGSNTEGGSNTAIDIGDSCVADEANTIRVGTVGTQTATYIAGISEATVTGTAVVVNGSGQLGLAPSSARFKDEIKPMDKASEALLSLRPVTFRYKKSIDPKGAAVWPCG